MASVKDLIAGNWEKEGARTYSASKRSFAFTYNCFGRVFERLLLDLEEATKNTK